MTKLRPELQALIDKPNNPMSVLDDTPQRSARELLQALPPGVDGKLLRQYLGQTANLDESTETPATAR